MAQSAVLPVALDAWFYVADDQPVGPLSAKALVELYREGRFPGDTLVWQAGTANWLPFTDSLAVALPASAAPPAPAIAEPASASSQAGDVRQTCAGCGKDWPEALMIRGETKTGPKWSCRLCGSRSAEENARHAKVKDTSGVSVKRGSLINWPGVLLIMASMVIFGGIRYTMRTGKLPFAGIFTGTQSAEKWSTQPPELWPPLTLASEFTAAPGAKPQRRANAVLVRKDDGRLAVLTLGAGVPVDLAGWKLLAPAGKTPLTLRAALPPATVDRKGILPLSVEGDDASPADKLPATPLRLRQLGVTTGMKVFAVGPGAASGEQAVYPGRVMLVMLGDNLVEIVLEKGAPAGSLNGGALLDGSGHLVGVITGSLDALTADNRVSSVVAVDTDILRKLLKP